MTAPVLVYIPWQIFKERVPIFCKQVLYKEREEPFLSNNVRKTELLFWFKICKYPLLLKIDFVKTSGCIP